MDRRVIGLGFCAISTVLYSVNYIVAAQLAQTISSWRTPPGRLGTAYEQVGTMPHNLAIVALIIGILYLVIGEVAALQRKEKP